MNKQPIILKLAFLIPLFSCLSFLSPRLYAQVVSNQTSFVLAIHSPEKSSLKFTSIDGYLSNLYIDSLTFVGIKKRIVFRFYSINPESLTLHGWENDNDLFEDTVDIKLSIGTKSTVPFGTGTYFGNLVLRRDDVKSIKRKLKKTNSRYVVFVPHDPKDPDQEIGQITYDIVVSKEDPSKQAFVPIPTGLSLNPSPPRNSN